MWFVVSMERWVWFIVSMERWVWFVHLVTFVREEDLVEYLSGLVLDGVYLHKMRWVSTGTSAAGGGGHTILTTIVLLSPSLSLPPPPPSPPPPPLPPSPLLDGLIQTLLYISCQRLSLCPSPQKQIDFLL